MNVSDIIENVLDSGIIDELSCQEDADNLTSDLTGAMFFSRNNQSCLDAFVRVLKATQNHLAKYDSTCGQPGTPTTALDDVISLALFRYNELKEDRMKRLAKS